MPALPDAQDIAAPHPDSLAPRDTEDIAVVARRAPVDYTSDGAIALNARGDSSILESRQNQYVEPGLIPTYYTTGGPAPGTIVGIVFGSVAGFLLIIWLFYSLSLINGGAGANIQGEEEIVVRRRRGSHSGRSRRSTRTEVREYSRSPRRRSQTIVEERRRSPRVRSIVVEERSRVPGDDVVEVIEEHDEYRARRGSRRSGGGYR